MLGRIILGFIAAAVAVLIAHQPIIWLLGQAGLILPLPRVFNMDALGTAPGAVASIFTGYGYKGVPIILNLVFWGGLWGALFGALYPAIPFRSGILKGLVFGIFMLVLGDWLLVPFIRGYFGTPNQAFFAGMVPQRMLVSGIINIGFTMMMGLIFGLLHRSDDRT